MSMVAAALPDPYPLGTAWDPILTARPGLAATAARYLAQIEVSLRPATVAKADEVLSRFCGHVVDHHPEVASFAEVGRPVIESFKLALASRLAPGGTPLKAKTIRVHLSLLKAFFARLVDWEWPEAPARIPIGSADMPRVPDPLPKALDDPAAARFLAAAAAESDRRRQLCVELLARTGMRVSELCGLADDAVSNRSGSAWLRVPVGKLYNDRYVPLHPRLVELLEAWAANHPDQADTGRLITKDDGAPLDRFMVARMVNRVARRAGLGHVHPHQLRHTLATQAINRGMRIEAVAELLGHRDIRMTLVYARMANRTVADQFAAVSAKVDALYVDPDDPDETPAMRRLRAEYRRMLGNGWCTRPRELDCSFEAICEGCGFFATGPEFLPRLRAQRDHAAAHDQHARQRLYEDLVAKAEATA
ncbi:MAG TPA: tyrosine-type recombinase/integrase [Acidimicrobiales bacterium]|nr:tyrosine-type recombinase/integrase [Acidimicrobiales bacterium]